MTGFRDLRRNQDFTAIWVGSTVSELGTRVSMFVFPLVAYGLTRSTVVAGVAGAMELLGMAAALLPAGVLADRVDRRRLMRATAAAGALGYATLVAACLADALTVPHLLAAGLLTGAAAGFFAPAESSALRAVVPTEQMTTALSQVQARQHLASLVGGPLGGALYAITRWAPFLFDSLTFAASWVLLGRVRADLSPAPRPAVRRRAADDLAEGLRFTWQRPVFRTLLFWSPCANLVINALFVAATLRLVQAGYPAWSIGLVETAAGACGILGALCAPWLTQRFATGALTVVVAWSFVPLLVPLVLWNHPAVVALSLSLGVFLNPAGNAGIGAYKLAITPPEIVGRVQAVNGFASWSTMPLAPVVAGVLLATLGGPTTMAALAGLVALVALIQTLSRSVRSVPRPAEWVTTVSPTCPERELVGVASA
jgi:predicted MFS family arabinose efflux permease